MAGVNMQMKAKQATKRVLIDKTQARTLATAVIASIITAFCLVASKSYLSQTTYLNKVASKKEAALKQLKSNEAAVSTLVASYKTFSDQNPNLIGGKKAGTAERDGDNGRLVLDALPSKYDFPALATSLEKLLTGYTINSIGGSDDTISQDQAENSTIVEMPFQLGVETNYTGMQTLIGTFEKSIRPFQVETLGITGTNAKLQITLTAKTFYQPEKDLKIEKKVVK